MQTLEADTIEAYLRDSDRLSGEERVRVERLSGGVSNRVFRIFRLNRPDEDFVVKQAQPRLETPDAWYCTVERIWREVAVLRACASLALAEQTPRILFEDRENYLFAMSAAPRDYSTWKACLLAGEADRGIAAECGRLMACIHGGTWNRADARRRFGDREIFETLRLDPYYRATAKARPEASTDFKRLIDSISEHAQCLVHADFSPKNLLRFGRAIMLIDFETGHFGDPAFDVGFLLSHLVLKSFERAEQQAEYLQLSTEFLSAYVKRMKPVAGRDAVEQIVARGIQHFAGCAWARLDGTSKIDYLDDPARRETVRAVCRRVFADRPRRFVDVLHDI